MAPAAAGEGAGAGTPEQLLIVHPHDINFGDVLEHSLSRTNVVLANGGHEPVLVTRLGRTCPDCMTSYLDSSNIVPGAASILVVSVCPENLPGEFDELVTIETASGVNHGIRVRARIIPSYSVSDTPFMLTAMQPGDTLRYSVRIKPSFPMKGTLQESALSNALLTVSVKRDESEPAFYRATVETKGAIPEGMTETMIEIQSTDPGDPPCRIYGSVFLPPPIHVYPSRLRLAASDREQLRILFVDQRIAPPAQITGVQTPGEDVTWEYLPGFNLEHSRLNVYVRNQAKKSGYIGDIVLTTDHQEVRQIRIPMMVDPRMAKGVNVDRGQVPVAGGRGCGCGTGI